MCGVVCMNPIDPPTLCMFFKVGRGEGRYMKGGGDHVEVTLCNDELNIGDVQDFFNVSQVQGWWLVCG